MDKHLPNIVVVVADSLRYDSTLVDENCGLPYTSAHSTRFAQCRSSGCWTLPATTSMFTGKLPHEHGATCQTRQVSPDHPTLAERLKEKGYRTIQVTANPVTTDIFGVDRGFDRVERVWKEAGRKHRSIDSLMALVSKARLRRKIISDTEDFVTGKMADDLEAMRVWLQSNAEYQFDRARQLIDEHNDRGEPVFMFVNLMESHFPYHIDDTFRTSSDSLVEKVRELLTLFHFVNQTRLFKDKRYIKPRMLRTLRERQRKAWTRLAPTIDRFVRQMHEETSNMVVFASDHGDNFGEQGWQYHFSNVTDAGNRVPLYVLDPGQSDSKEVTEHVSLRDLYGTILRRSGVSDDTGLIDLVEDEERSVPVLESYWYNREGKTLPKYRFNQFAFVEGDQKYIRRNDQWLSSRIANGVPEAPYRPLPGGTDPLEDVDMPSERREYIRTRYEDYESFSRNLL